MTYRRKPAAGQQPLPLDVEYAERFRLLESVHYSRSGLSQRRWNNVVALLSAVHRLNQGSGCWASSDRLADECRYSRRTLFRASQDAQELGVLEVENRVRKGANGGRAFNSWRIDWGAFARLGSAIPACSAPSCAGECQNALGECQDAEVECQFGTAIEENSKLSSSSRDGSSATEEACIGFGRRLSPGGLDEVRRRGNAILAAVGKPRPNTDDWEYAAKIAVLSVERLGEHWLASSLEAVRHGSPKTPWRFWRGVLVNNTREFLQLDLRRLLAQTSVPEVLRRRSPPIDLSERLCVAGGEP
ncbi:hypothetical protein KOR34_37260 [Posidoniimonas corsicana]|uniref:Helix-turn-helix domain-containing protein n=1 Tax=Posidoniimonas corsicana TaxID=1938618 RepID=A0A5C5V733_9BACT|nr:hypothetical protein [Posidoniimonas corsicana]TWT33890.1 hypothetical protein KOR34_37260 [Posidoniimonas corsicana]